MTLRSSFTHENARGHGSRLLWGAWLTFLLAGVLFSFVTPLGEGIDEPAHFEYVRYVAHRRVQSRDCRKPFRRTRRSSLTTLGRVDWISAFDVQHRKVPALDERKFRLPERWPVATFAFLLFALLIYSAVFVAWPHYSGLTRRGATYHFFSGDFSLMRSRLLRLYLTSE